MGDIARQKGKHHNLTRSAKNRATGKYKKQVVRTAMNKARNRKRAAELKKIADQRRNISRGL